MFEIYLIEMGSVQCQTHSTASEESSSRDRNEPRQKKQENSLPVDRPQTAIAKTDTDGGTGDTHGCGDWQFVL